MRSSDPGPDDVRSRRAHLRPALHLLSAKHIGASSDGHVVKRDDQSDLAAELLAYLRDHPEAADTADGITQWWIHRQRLAVVRAAVEAALEELVESGHLVRRTTAGGHVVYCTRPTDEE